MQTVTEAVPLYQPNPYLYQITRTDGTETPHRCIVFLDNQPDIYTVNKNTIVYRLNQKITVIY